MPEIKLWFQWPVNPSLTDGGAPTRRREGRIRPAAPVWRIAKARHLRQSVMAAQPFGRIGVRCARTVGPTAADQPGIQMKTKIKNIDACLPVLPAKLRLAGAAHRSGIAGGSSSRARAGHRRRGAEQGSREGGRDAGPVGAVVGGAVGAGVSVARSVRWMACSELVPTGYRALPRLLRPLRSLPLLSVTVPRHFGARALPGITAWS